jgi:hypothetical protein
VTWKIFLTGVVSVGFFFAGVWFEGYRSSMTFRESVYITCIERVDSEALTASLLKNTYETLVEKCGDLARLSVYKIHRTEDLPPGFRPVAPEKTK